PRTPARRRGQPARHRGPASASGGAVPLRISKTTSGARMSTHAPVGIGIIGAGYISSIYLENCTTRFDNLRVVGVADIVPANAQRQAERYGVAAMSIDDLLASPEIEIVVNLTIPAAHGEVALQAIEAGKSVYNEKPLAATRESAREVLD